MRPPNKPKKLSWLNGGLRARGEVENKPYLHYVYSRYGPVEKTPPHPSPASANAARWSRRSVLTASRARHRSALAMVIAALASALVTPRSRKVLAACEEQCYGAHDGLIEPRRRACGGVTKAPATSLRSRHRPRCLARHCGLSMWPLEYLQKTCTRPQVRGPGRRAGTG